jgi:predicted dehydrogenase
MTDLSRRAFLSGASAAVALPVLGVPRPARAGQPDTRPAPLRIGLIGCGGRGTGAAMQALRADRGAVLVAAGDVFADRLESCLSGIARALSEGDEADPDAAKRVAVAPDKRFVGFDSYQKVIDSGVDVVLLTSYPCFRPAHLAAAVKAGKHVFAEKPLAVDAQGVRSAIESARLAKEKNLALLVGFCWRYNAGMKETYARVNAGELGEVLNVHTTYHTSTLTKRPRKPEWSDTEFQLRNWWHFTWISGDHVVEQAVHSIDRLSWAMNDLLPARVNCLGGRAARSGPEHGNVFDHFAAVYEYPDGRRAFHTTRQIDGCPSDNTDYLYGTKGTCVVNGWQPTYLIKDLQGAKRWSFSGDIRDMYQAEHDALFASIRAGKPINDGERGAHSTLLAIMARMAAYTGQTVSWDQALNSQERLVPDKLELGAMPTPPVAVPGKTKLI